MEYKIPFKRVLVTGGVGFIGHRLVEQLLGSGCEVLVFDSLHNYMDYQTSSYHKILGLRLQGMQDRVKLVQGDIRNVSHLTETMQDFAPEAVVHLAAVPIAAVAAKQRTETIAINLDGSINVLEAIKATPSVKHMVYTSSSMTYGDFETVPVPETAKKDPIEIYGTSKLCGEFYTRTYSRMFDFTHTIIRPSAVNGTGAINRSVLQLFCQQALTGNPITVINGDNQYLDFTHVDDLVQGFMLALSKEEAKGETFNITKGEANNLTEVVNVLKDLFPELTVVEREPLEIKMPVRGALDVSKARKLLGYSPQYNVRDCVISYLEFYKQVLGDERKADSVRETVH